MNNYTVYTTLYMHNSHFYPPITTAAKKPSQPVLSHIVQAYLKISMVQVIVIYYKVVDWPPKKYRKVNLG